MTSTGRMTMAEIDKAVTTKIVNFAQENMLKLVKMFTSNGLI
jgi:hypothetical protein